MSQIFGIPVEIVPKHNIKIADIMSESKISASQLRDVIDDFVAGIDKLEKIKNGGDKSGSYKTVNNTYHWIKLSDMPGFEVKE
jgi:hypothetical protein